MVKPIEQDIRKFPDLESLSRAAAEAIFETACEAVSMKGCFSLALAGGNTPRITYRILADEYSDKIPWSSTHLFWGDERYVPKNHPDSNYTMAYQTLISKLPIPAQNIHPIPTEMENPGKVAVSYEKLLRGFFQNTKADSVFDLILLGMGDDGHTASLFPGDPVLEEKEKWVNAVFAPPIYKTCQRITFTLPLINSAENVFFLVSGAKKKGVLKSIIEESDVAIKKYPAAMIRPKCKKIWFVDKEVL